MAAVAAPFKITVDAFTQTAIEKVDASTQTDSVSEDVFDHVFVAVQHAKSGKYIITHAISRPVDDSVSLCFKIVVQSSQEYKEFLKYVDPTFFKPIESALPGAFRQELYAFNPDMNLQTKEAREKVKEVYVNLDFPVPFSEGTTLEAQTALRIAKFCTILFPNMVANLSSFRCNYASQSCSGEAMFLKQVGHPTFKLFS